MYRLVCDGEIKANHEIFREASTLSHRLRFVQNPMFKEEFHTQSNDVGLIMLLDRQSRRMGFFFKIPYCNFIITTT